jgi:hypothetical protein
MDGANLATSLLRRTQEELEAAAADLSLAGLLVAEKRPGAERTGVGGGGGAGGRGRGGGDRAAGVGSVVTGRQEPPGGDLRDEWASA